MEAYLMGWSPNHGRIKERYNPNPNAAERAFEAWLRDQPCYGCGRWGVEIHHTLLRFPEKRWRRDHRWQLPVCPQCHRGKEGIHGMGDEAAWLESIGKSEGSAIAYMNVQWGLSQRKAA